MPESRQHDHPSPDGMHSCNVGALVTRYTEEVARRQAKSARDIERHLAYLVELIGADTPLASVRPRDISAARDRWLQGVTPRGTRRTPTSANRLVATWSGAFRFAAKRLFWIGENPVTLVERDREPPTPGIALDGAAIRKIVAALDHDPDTQLAVMLLASTGLRRGEVAALRWRDVDLERERLIIEHTKTGKPRSVAVGGRALEELRQRRGADDEPVVRRHPDVIGHRFTDAAASLGIRCRLHDLRHSFASALSPSVSLVELADVLGHSTLACVRRYQHRATTPAAAQSRQVASALVG